MKKQLPKLFLACITSVSLTAATAQEGKRLPLPAGVLKKEIPGTSEKKHAGHYRTASCGPDTVLYPYLKELVFTAPADSFFVDAMVGNVRTASQAYHLNDNVNVLGVQFWGAAYSTSTSPQTLQVVAYLYAIDASNMPTTKLDSVYITITEQYDFYEAAFATPHPVNGNFAVAVKSVPSDTLAVITNNAGNVWAPNYGEGLAWRRFGSGTWNSSMAFFGQDLEYMIFPIVSYNVTSSFTASDTEICEGATVTFNHTSSPLYDHRMFNLYAFDAYWGFAAADSSFYWNSGDNPSWVSGGSSVTFPFNTPGTFETKLAGEMIGYYTSCSDTAGTTITVGEIYTDTVSASICAGETYDFGSMSLNTEGTYTQTFMTIMGCDSTVTLTLNIDTVDVSVTASGNTITASLGGATYQWMDCSTNTPVSGATSQSFTAVANGDYSVIVTSGTCSDTSDCVSIVTTGTQENAELARIVSLYPNPSEGLINVRTKGIVADNIIVTNVIGEVVQSIKPLSFATTIDLTNTSHAIYFVTVKYQDAVRTFKVTVK